MTSPPPLRCSNRSTSAPPATAAGPATGICSCARLRELQREPEVIFWIFIFPLLLALGLGIAFRNKPADATPRRHRRLARAHACTLALLEARRKHALHSRRSAAARQARKASAWQVRSGDRPETDGSFEFRYDPARPESALARLAVDDALQAAAGRKDPLATTTVTASDRARRYIDFLIPGLSA